MSCRELIHNDVPSNNNSPFVMFLDTKHESGKATAAAAAPACVTPNRRLQRPIYDLASDADFFFKKKTKVIPSVYMGTAPMKIKDENGQDRYVAVVFLSDGAVNMETPEDIIQNIEPCFIDHALADNLDEKTIPTFTALDMKAYNVIGSDQRQIVKVLTSKDTITNQKSKYYAKAHMFNFFVDEPLTKDSAFIILNDRIMAEMNRMKYRNKHIMQKDYDIDPKNFWLGNIYIGNTIGTAQVKKYVNEYWPDFRPFGQAGDWTQRNDGLIQNLWPKGQWTWLDALYFGVPYEFCSVAQIEYAAKAEDVDGLLERGHGIE